MDRLNNLQKKIRGLSDQIFDLQNQYLDMLAAAYLKHTDIPPDESVLVQEFKNGKWYWYFRRKDEI